MAWFSVHCFAPAAEDLIHSPAMAPRGRLFRVLQFTFANGRIASMQVIGDPERLQSIEVGLLDD